MNKIKEAVEFISEKVLNSGHEMPELALTLGSGLGFFAENARMLLEFPYGQIPNFPVSTVAGHKSRLILAKDPETKKNFWIMQGRVHFYEGYTMDEVVFPVRVLIKLGMKKYVVTNAAGGVNPNFEAGDLMIIRDHINMMGTNPLIGPNKEEFGTRFPDMSRAYSRKMSLLIQKAALETGVSMKEGVYMALTGPTFETPAEVRMLAKLGADAVGMSTVPEVIAAKHASVEEVAGISFISNQAAGISREPLSHEEVGKNAKKIEKVFAALMNKFVTMILRGSDD